VTQVNANIPKRREVKRIPVAKAKNKIAWSLGNELESGVSSLGTGGWNWKTGLSIGRGRDGSEDTISLPTAKARTHATSVETRIRRWVDLCGPGENQAHQNITITI
jgi:hypothetical protein